MIFIDVWRLSFVFYVCWVDKFFCFECWLIIFVFFVGFDRIWRFWLVIKGMDSDLFYILSVFGGIDRGLEWEIGFGE